jgi:hypothetical protein
MKSFMGENLPTKRSTAAPSRMVGGGGELIYQSLGKKEEKTA